ncbi:DNA mismatch endonuclease Vsr [Microbacterium sp. SYP-A9085]|uniref:very short patch repair endonuclease n=1 Tax=Microbacterium sp. SYP-A9085 TaxID=2664454 RepID=UPI00129AA810|nr:DNA mismatch endonuclease Vsr [Microbacterium sp. SYP-A9085]
MPTGLDAPHSAPRANFVYPPSSYATAKDGRGTETPKTLPQLWSLQEVGLARSLTYSVSVTNSWATSERARRTMIANRSRDTAPELAVRSLLHARGLRYRTNFRPDRTLRRTADVVFTRRRVAVFIDGCFWHGCPTHLAMPRSHVEYWGPKIQRNRDRDQETNELLRAAGWTVLRFWEHEDPAEVADSIAAVLDFGDRASQTDSQVRTR